MHVESIKSESHVHIALQDFTRKHRIPHTIKIDNARTETGEKWTEQCRRLHINQKYTKLYHLYQNYAEHGI